jgi:hypothetical protein
MNQRTLFFIAISINVFMIFLLVQKENNIIKQLHALQKLQEQKNDLLQQYKTHMLTLHELTQLDSIEHYAQTKLQMSPITLRDAHILEAPSNKECK